MYHAIATATMVGTLCATKLAIFFFPSPSFYNFFHPIAFVNMIKREGIVTYALLLVIAIKNIKL